MPEPSDSPINSDEERYGNGANAVSTEHTTPLVVFTTQDQAAERDKTLKRVAKINAPQRYLKRIMFSQENEEDGTTKRREW